jgi:uncharacterized protein YjbI with pentapeptide repeats
MRLDTSRPGWQENLALATDSAQTISNFASAIKANYNIEELEPLVQGVTSLLEILNSPLVQIIGNGVPFITLGASLIRLFSTVTKREPNLEECIAIVSQVAYLESLRSSLNQHQARHIAFNKGEPAPTSTIRKIRSLAKVEISEDEAMIALSCFHSSKLAKAFNPVLKDRLIDAGMNERMAARLSQQVSRNTYKHIRRAMIESKNHISQLIGLFENSWSHDIGNQVSLDCYLMDQISSETTSEEYMSRWKVLDEDFTIKDIYIPLKAQPLDKAGYASSEKPVLLQDWAENYYDTDSGNALKRILFIQAPPGRGKTVFCRIFADWVREYLHPIWTPILIRLRDIQRLNESFEIILQKAIHAQFAKRDDWLYNPNIRYMFILDGFDELLMEGRTTDGLRTFLKQAGEFQKSSQESLDMQHTIVLTGRTLALQEIEGSLPYNLERFEILPMDFSMQKDWLKRWSGIMGEEVSNSFHDFLTSPFLPKTIVGTADIIGLAQEPLLLLLLAVMHKDDQLINDQFENIEAEEAKIAIYNKSLEWALHRQTNADPCRNLNEILVRLEPREIRRILQEVGLCVIQTGGEWAPIEMVSKRLQDDDIASKFLDEAQKAIGENPLRNALVSFYLQPASDLRDGGVEFVHKSFGEFLCAERIKSSLDIWSEPGWRVGRTHYIDNLKMQEEIYELLGFGFLSIEVIDFLSTMLRSEIQNRTSNNTEENKEAKSKLISLFDRLTVFFEKWCRAEFINNCTAHIPLRIAMRLEHEIGPHKVDVYTGVNLFMILMKLHQLQIEEIRLNMCEDRDGKQTLGKLSSIISYCNAMAESKFVEVAGRFMAEAYLAGSDLRQVNLKGATLVNSDLSEADLCRADLTRADCENANLANAYLRAADLKEVNLYKANLENADLCRSYLYNANLKYSNLKHASIKGANLEGANLEGANLNGIVWDATTQWFGCEGLHNVIADSIPPDLLTHEDFIDSVQLSRCFEYLDGMTSPFYSFDEATVHWISICERIRTRRGVTVFSHLLNRFAWLNCLNGFYGKAIIDMSKKAVNHSPHSGNFKDTLAVTIAIYFGQTGCSYPLSNQGNEALIYHYCATLLEDALKSNDFRKLALPVAGDIKQRRMEWIEDLRRNINPFTTEALAVLLREER